MEDGNGDQKAQPSLVDVILQYGKQAFDPEESEQIREFNYTKFNELLKRCVCMGPSASIAVNIV